MRDLSILQNRYLRDTLAVRLGNLASNLAHISSFAKKQTNPVAVERLLDESRFFIEWTAAEAQVEKAEELVALQIQLSEWLHNWNQIQNNPDQLKIVTQRSSDWSERVLNISGLLEEV